MKTLSYRRYEKNGEKNVRFYNFICSRGWARNLCFHADTLIQNSLGDDRPSISISINRINPRPTRFVSGKANECIDDGLKDIRWIRGLAGDRLPAASYALLPNLKKGLLFAIGEWSRFLVVCFLLTSDQVFGYHTPRRRPPRITGRVVNTATRGWVGAPNERAAFRFHDAVVGFVDPRLSRTRNLAASY